MFGKYPTGFWVDIKLLKVNQVFLNMLEELKTQILSECNEAINNPEITPEDAGKIARLIAYVNINLK